MFESRVFCLVATNIFILFAATFNNILPTLCLSSDLTSSPTTALSVGQDDLHDLLNTEMVLIDTLRNYIEVQEEKLKFLKSKTSEIRHIYDGVTDREKYVYNPINALTILKRFTSDWTHLKAYAEDFLEMEDLTKNYTQKTTALTFPTEEDYDEALMNLLRIQDIYQLEPQQLAVGEINGVKLGSEMTWSDCFEIGSKSNKNGYQTYAKYWLETALEKLSKVNDSINANNINSASDQSGLKGPSSQDDYAVTAKLEILKSLLNTEYNLGNLQEALNIANKIIELGGPKQKNVLKAKTKIEKKLKQQKTNKGSHANGIKDKKQNKYKSAKTVEEQMIAEICREASTQQTKKQIHSGSSYSAYFSYTPHIPSCSITTNNLAFLLMQPLKVELLNLDPYIVIYHQILSDRQIEELKDFVAEKQEDDYDDTDEMFEFTKIGNKKMRQINVKLYDVLGHYGQESYDDWQVQRYNFERIMQLEKGKQNNGNSKKAKLLLNLQQPLLGGSVIFPQLELSINVPLGSMLYWSTLNEFSAYDYRSNYYICPVIGGSQITATTSIKNII